MIAFLLLTNYMNNPISFQPICFKLEGTRHTLFLRFQEDRIGPLAQRSRRAWKSESGSEWSSREPVPSSLRFSWGEFQWSQCANWRGVCPNDRGKRWFRMRGFWWCEGRTQKLPAIRSKRTPLKRKNLVQTPSYYRLLSCPHKNRPTQELPVCKLAAARLH